MRSGTGPGTGTGTGTMPRFARGVVGLVVGLVVSGCGTVGPEPIELRAGPLSVLFTPENGWVRYVRVGDVEVLRGIYAAVRDENWGTVKPELSRVAVDQGDDAFEVTFDVECRQGNIDFAWSGRILGTAPDTLLFEFDGEARSTFLRNRIGFCVLHPPQVAGAGCLVETADGESFRDRFPELISPHQPFKNIRAIAHQVRPALWARVSFEGEVFEMEDQRNWTDASFKTYCTPLELAFPVEVAAGTRIEQSVTVKLLGRAPREAVPLDPRQEPIVLTIAGPSRAVPLPRIGLQAASHGQTHDEHASTRLRALNLDHLRVDLRLSSDGWAADLRRAAREARRLDTGLHVALHLGEDVGSQLGTLVEALPDIRPEVGVWLVFREGEKTTDPRLVELARERLRAWEGRPTVGGGTNAYFTELNRGRPDVSAFDRVVYSINPQVHAFDDRSLVETLAMQGETVRSARQFVGDRPLLVSPVTLKPRFNPNATGPQPAPQPGELPARVDPRQPSLFNAGWTVGSVKYLAEAGADGVTYFETTGWLGVMETPDGPPEPELFDSIPGGVYPVYHVFADIGEFAGGRVRPVRSSRPLAVHGLCLEKGDSLRLLVANVTGERRDVIIHGLSGPVRVRHLDERTRVQAMRSPEAFHGEPGETLELARQSLNLSLLPHAVTRIDWAK